MSTIGIDLGGTKVMAVLVENGEVVAKAKKPTPRGPCSLGAETATESTPASSRSNGTLP